MGSLFKKAPKNGRLPGGKGGREKNGSSTFMLSHLYIANFVPNKTR